MSPQCVQITLLHLCHPIFQGPVTSEKVINKPQMHQKSLHVAVRTWQMGEKERKAFRAIGLEGKDVSGKDAHLHTTVPMYKWH